MSEEDGDWGDAYADSNDTPFPQGANEQMTAVRIMQLTEEDKKREVVYEDGCGGREYGNITSWNHRFVFVRYYLKITADGSQIPRTGTTSEATDPDDLHFTEIAKSW